MYCQKCGAENLENAAICQSCGGVFVYSQPIKTSGMAITSMILSVSTFPLVFGVFGIVSIIGLVFGLISLNRINKSGGQLRGKGFAITGIAVSSVGLAIILTIIGIMVFFSSALSLSTHHKLKMQEASKIPELQGTVNVVYAKAADANENCSSPLFVPQELHKKIDVEGKLQCQSDKNSPVAVTWEFVGDNEDNELYSFDIVISNEGKSTEFVKTVEFDGNYELVYKDKQVKVFISPVEAKK